MYRSTDRESKKLIERKNRRVARPRKVIMTYVIQNLFNLVIQNVHTDNLLIRFMYFKTSVQSCPTMVQGREII